MRTKALFWSSIAAGALLALLWMLSRAESRAAAAASGRPGANPAPAAGATVLALARAPEEVAGPRESMPTTPRVAPAASDPSWRAEHAAAPPRGVERRLTGRFERADRTPAGGEELVVQLLRPHVAPVAREEIELAPDGGFEVAFEPEWTGVRLTLRSAQHTRFDRYFVLPASTRENDVGLGTLVLSTGGTITGLVRGLGGERSFCVTAMPRDRSLPEFLARASTGATPLDADGRFRFEHVPAGEVELILSHPGAGVVVQHMLAVEDGATTRFAYTYAGPAPARALFVRTAFARGPLASEIWLDGDAGRTFAPTSLDGRRVVFADLPDDAYTLTLAFAELEPVVRTGFRPGTWVEVAPEPAPEADVMQLFAGEAAGDDMNVRMKALLLELEADSATRKYRRVDR